MQHLIYKEIKLSIHPTCFIFLLLTPMLLIPNYPYYVAFFYQTLGIFFTFVNGNITNDIFFTALLPIRKRDVVKSRVLTIVALQIVQILLSIPFAFIRVSVIDMENLAGMEANPALFGLVFIMYGIFNLVFLSMFYKTAYKTGFPYLAACGAMTLFVVIAELTIQLIPVVKQILDTTLPAYLPQQMAVLAIGVVAFIALTIAAYQRSVRQFERLDL